jgi:hypothetical protein
LIEGNILFRMTPTTYVALQQRKVKSYLILEDTHRETIRQKQMTTSFPPNRSTIHKSKKQQPPLIISRLQKRFSNNEASRKGIMHNIIVARSKHQVQAI